MSRKQWMIAALLFTIMLAAQAGARAADWRTLAGMPDGWYASNDGRHVIESILARQHTCGGWDKNYDPTGPWDPGKLAKEKDKPATIDNDATVSEMRVLANAYQATGDPLLEKAFVRGLTYLFDAQYDNGGWPQYYPLRGGYHDAITYNDDAMVNVLVLMRDIALNEKPFTFLDDKQREQARIVFKHGIQAVVKTQVVVDGQPTVWCAQHDAVTLKPTKARAYEHPSLSGAESARIVQLLMSLDNPPPEVIRSVQAAVHWFEQTAIRGVTYKRVTLPDGKTDRRLVPSDNPDECWWARFYEIGTNRPIFSGRDSVIRYNLSEVEDERRNGYAWYTRRAADLLTKQYPAWQKRWAPGRDARALR